MSYAPVKSTNFQKPAIIDAAGDVWTLVQSASSGLRAAKNSVIDTTTANVVELLYLNRLLYQTTSAGEWFVFKGSGWASTSGPIVSASSTMLTGRTGLIEDSNRRIWIGVQSASNGARIGRADAGLLLLYYKGVRYRRNNRHVWWSCRPNVWMANSIPSSVAPTPTPVGATARFHVSNGQIIDPNGNIWVGKGINVDDWAGVGGGGPGNIGNGTKIVDSSGNPVGGSDGLYIFEIFPNCNIVRLPCSYHLKRDSSGYNDDPSDFVTFVNNLTARKCVVVLEDHPGSSPMIPKGPNTTQQQWYSHVAALFKSNPHVWYGTINEPWGKATPDVICQNQRDTYSTLRNAGVTSPILLEIANPPNAWGSSWQAAQAHYFGSMYNVVWDLHIYGGAGSSTQSQSANNEAIAAAVAGVVNNGITSADGKIPILVGEYGPSTTGISLDANGTQNVIAVQTAQVNGLIDGSLAWSWSNAMPDNLQNQGYRTKYGNEVNGYMNGTIPSSWKQE